MLSLPRRSGRNAQSVALTPVTHSEPVGQAIADALAALDRWVAPEPLDPADPRRVARAIRTSCGY